MNISNFILINFILLFISKGVSADSDYGKGDVTPLKHERLDQSLYLQGRCSRVEITEWRYGQQHVKRDEKFKKSIDIINKTCALVFDNFEEFMKTQPGYVVNGYPEYVGTKISLIPVDTKPRSLNDTKYRFSERKVTGVLWGYHDQQFNYVFIRNVIYNGNDKDRYFELYFAHELFHSLSYELGIYHQHKGSVSEVVAAEEAMADEFTVYLGLGK